MIITFAIEGDETQVLSFDAVLSFSEKMSGKVTEYETEFGFPINDNIVLSNPKFSVNGVLSTFVDDDILIQYDGFGFYSDLDGDLPTITDLENKVRDIYLGKKPFSIYRSQDKNNPFSTSERVIENCVISDLSFAYDSEKYGAVYPQMEITQLNLVKVEEVDNTNASPQLIPETSVASAGSTKASKKEALDGTSPSAKSSTIDAKSSTGEITASEKTARANNEYEKQQVLNQIEITKRKTHIAEKMGSMKGSYDTIGGAIIYTPPNK